MNVPIAKRPDLLRDRVSPQLAPRAFQALEQWDVTKHLGWGASAEVWLLEDKDRRRQIACKTPHQGSFVAKLSQEAKLAAQLSHENIIQPIEIGDDPDLRTLHEVTFWEFLAGGSLAQLIGASGQLTVAQTVTVVLPMIQATQYLQNRQIAHGDISPNNIMFDLTGRPVLIDLGTTRATAHHYARTGSPGFIAPELVVSSSSESWDLEARADIYALAAVAWFCLTGTAPGSVQHRIPLTALRSDLDLEIVELLEAGLSAEPILRPDLETFAVAVAQWAIPQPVDLYASVGEDYGLVLPTRQPRQEVPSKKLRRRAKPSTARHPRGTQRRIRSESTRRRRAQRLIVALSALLLACGAVFTLSYRPDSTQDSLTAEHEMPPLPSDDDHQAIIDNLVKTRSAAWNAPESARVADYALRGSPVFRDDSELLSVLADQGHHLEGIRMRAVVEEVSESRDRTRLKTTWRTDGYVQRDEAGNLIRQVEPQEETIELEIANTAGGWRIAAAR